MCSAVCYHLPHILTVALQRQLPVLNVTTDTGELRLAAAAFVLHQSKTGIDSPADGCRTGDAVEHIIGSFLSQMMDQQDGDTVGIRNPFQSGEVTVVVGVGVVVVGAADHLQRVDDDQHCVRMFGEECAELLLQTLADGSALRTEMDAVRRVLCDLEEAVLDAKDGVLQAEIEGGALLHAHSPDRFSLGHRHRQPQGQPGLAHLG